jgi:hypothetical protein
MLIRPIGNRNMAFFLAQRCDFDKSKRIDGAKANVFPGVERAGPGAKVLRDGHFSRTDNFQGRRSLVAVMMSWFPLTPSEDRQSRSFCPRH